MNHHPPTCQPALLRSSSAAMQDFSPTVPTGQARAACGNYYLRGHSGDTLTWDLDLVMQQMNH